MASSNNNPNIILKRTFSLKDHSPLILCIDSLAQSSKYVIEEFVHNVADDIPIIFVSYETPAKPKYASQYIDASDKDAKQLVAALQPHLPQPQEKAPKLHLVVFDSLNYIAPENLTKLVSAVASPFVTMLATYHQSIPAWRPTEIQNYPDAAQLLQFIANVVIEVSQNTSIDEEDLEADLCRFRISKGLNSLTYYITLTNKRKSGRSMRSKFLIDSKTHAYEVVTDKSKESVEESPEMFEGLTTFNLNTSAKQKLAKDQVALPYLEAQSFSSGGAIVYEYEKDDDYDEEDPYEDPF